MKRNIFIAVALFATMAANAQNIAVVNPSNETTVYQTLDEAVTGADPGSIIYLPGGGFQIKNETKITKKLTIMGVSHRGDTDNADGATVIAGNLNFDKGSSGSSVIGVYISGDVNVGTVTDSVLNLTVKYCNVNSIQVKHSQSSGMVVNQCYMRKTSNFNGSAVIISNSISDKIFHVNGVIIRNNVFIDRDGRYYAFSDPVYAFDHFYNTIIYYNIVLTKRVHRGNASQGYSNLVIGSSWGDEPIVIDANSEDILERDKGVTPGSSYHFKEKYKEYEDQVGIYAGSTPFRDDKSLAPIPRIVSKKVDEQTDGSGKLHIEVTIKAK